jgi:hypothetical protein
MKIDWKSPNAILALILIMLGFGLLYLVLFRGLGGNEAVFAILGYLAGWLNSIILFFYRRAPNKDGK